MSIEPKKQNCEKTFEIFPKTRDIYQKFEFHIDKKNADLRMHI